MGGGRPLKKNKQGAGGLFCLGKGRLGRKCEEKEGYLLTRLSKGDGRPGRGTWQKPKRKRGRTMQRYKEERLLIRHGYKGKERRNGTLKAAYRQHKPWGVEILCCVQARTREWDKKKIRQRKRRRTILSLV